MKPKIITLTPLGRQASAGTFVRWAYTVHEDSGTPVLPPTLLGAGECETDALCLNEINARGLCRLTAPEAS